jgi:hypothetical protein
VRNGRDHFSRGVSRYSLPWHVLCASSRRLSSVLSTVCGKTVYTSNRIASQTIAASRCLAGAKYMKNSRDFSFPKLKNCRHKHKSRRASLSFRGERVWWEKSDEGASGSLRKHRDVYFAKQGGHKRRFSEKVCVARAVCGSDVGVSVRDDHIFTLSPPRERDVGGCIPKRLVRAVELGHKNHYKNTSPYKR